MLEALNAMEPQVSVAKARSLPQGETVHWLSLPFHPSLERPVGVAIAKCNGCQNSRVLLESAFDVVPTVRLA